MEEALKKEDIESRISQLDGHWTVSDDNKQIECTFRFDDAESAFKFVEKLAELAEEESHHPEICLSYNKVKVILWTHAVDGLSDKDFVMAKKAEALLKKPY